MTRDGSTPTPPVGGGWHVTDVHLTAYRAGEVGDVLAASVEAHLLGCEACRGRLAAQSVADPVAAERSARRWEALADAVDRPRGTAVGRTLGRLGLPTAPLRQAWAAAFVVACALPLVLASFTELPDALPLLVLAPVVPVLATAFAFSADVDPAGELALVAPVAGFRRLVERSVVVGVAVVPAGLLAAYGLGLPVGQAAAWLLPGLALAALVLLAATLGIDAVRAGVALGAAWALAVLAPGLAGPEAARTAVEVVAGPLAQVAAAVVLVVAATLATGRRQLVGAGRPA